MIESVNPDLAAHRSAPDKTPARRLATLDAAGEAGIPFTTGLLVGIGESRADRLATLEAIAASHRRHGHVQEVIVQNFLPKPGTSMHQWPPCPTDEFLWTIAAARLVLPTDIHLQAPPNLSDDLGPPRGLGHRRLGRRLAGDRRPREPRTGLARPRHPARGHRGRRPHARPPADPLPRVRPRPRALARPGHAVPGARRLRRRGPGTRPPVVARAARYPRRSWSAPRSRSEGPPRAPPPPHRPPVATLASTGSAVGEVLAGVTGRGDGGRGRDRDPVRRPGPRGPGRGRGGRPAPVRRRRRRGHLRRQPQHQLHQRVHVQVQVLRLLQGPALPQPPGHALPPGAERHLRPGGRGRGAGGHRGLPAGRHPPQVRRRLLPRGDPGRPRGVGHHPHPRVHRPRGHRGGPALRDAAGRLPDPAAGRRAEDAPGHRRRDPRRRGPGHPLPGQDQHRGVAVRPPHRPRGRVCAPTSPSCSAPSSSPGPGPATWCGPGTCSARPAASPSSCPSPSSTWPPPSTSSSGPGGVPPSARPS